MPFFRSYQKVVYCQSIIAFNRFFHGQLYGTECHKPTHPRTMTQNGIFLAKKAILEDSSIIPKVLFYAFPIHMRKGVDSIFWILTFFHSFFFIYKLLR